LKRNAIALLVTISFVTVIVALIGISSGIVNDSFKRVSDKLFLIQGNVLFSDMIGILKEASGDVNDSMGLDLFLSVPLFFENKQNDLSVDISFKSEASTININHLLEEGNTSKKRDPYAPIPLKSVYEAYFDRILTVYNLSDKIMLLSMIADTLDTDLDERSTGSEIALQDPFFTQGHIYSMQHFEQILEAYKKQTLDFYVDSVPWDLLIGFHADQTDFNHMTPEVLQHLAPEIDPESLPMFTTDKIDIYEDMDGLPFDTETKERLKEMQIVFYNPTVSGIMNIRNGERRMQIAFLYDLSNKKVSNIEVSN